MNKSFASSLVLALTLAACGAENGGGQIKYMPQGGQTALDGNYATECFKIGESSMKRTVTIGGGELIDRTFSYSDSSCRNEGARDEDASRFEIGTQRTDGGPNSYNITLTHKDGRVEKTSAARFLDGRFMFGDKTDKNGHWQEDAEPDGYIDEGLKVVP